MSIGHLRKDATRTSLEQHVTASTHAKRPGAMAPTSFQLMAAPRVEEHQILPNRSRYYVNSSSCPLSLYYLDSLLHHPIIISFEI